DLSQLESTLPPESTKVNAICWCVSDNQQELEPKHKISLEDNKKYKNYDKYFVYSKYIERKLSKKFGDIKNYFTVSDDKFVSMPIEKVDSKINYISKTEEKDEMKIVSEIKKTSVKRIKIGIFNFETGENLFLSLPYSEMIIKYLAFLDGNKLIMISKNPLYRIYIFIQGNNEFIHKSTIKVETYNEKIFLSNGKLFIYDGNLGSITKWDINTSKFEAYFLFDNSFDIDNMKLSDNGIFLFVYGRKRVDNWYKDPYPCISVYFADHGNKFTTFIFDAVYLIASDVGARLLIVHHKKNEEKKYQYHLCNPFAPYIPGESFAVNDLFKDFEAKGDEVFENKYIIKDDKIVGFNKDEKLVIKRLIADNDNWISYLRNTLEDFSSIFIPSISEKIIGLIVKSKKTTEKATFDINEKHQYSKYFVTWTLTYEKNTLNNIYIFLTAKFKNDETKTDSINIVPELYIRSDRDVEKFVKECDCLDNDDLVIVTALGVLIWEFNIKDNKIELKYFWSDEGDSWDWDRIEVPVIKLFYEIDEKTFDEKNFDIKKLKKRSYFLPPSSYISMIRYNFAFIQPLDENRFFFNELIEKHIKNRLFLIFNGQKLIKDIVKEDEDMLLRKVFNGCIEQIEKDEETLNTQIFDLFSQSITEIFKKNPSFFEEFVIKISLLCVLEVEKKDQILNHLHHYQNYIHIREFRKFIDDINSNNWKESTKPIITTKIKKILKYKKQESETDKIHNIYEQESDTDKSHKIYEKQKSEADKIQKMSDKIQKICEKQELEADKIQKMYEKQENFQKLLEKIVKKLEIQSSKKYDN
ncbi:6817_t:CDS:2, partial [Gigaspora rosea]